MTVGGDKGFDTAEFVRECRNMRVTPHVSQNLARRGGSAIDGRTTQHASYLISQKKRKRIEECFGWLKTIALLRKVRHRGTLKVDWMFTFACAAYNLVRMRNLMRRYSSSAVSWGRSVFKRGGNTHFRPSPARETTRKATRNSQITQTRTAFVRATQFFSSLLAKLFPPGNDPSRQDLASDIFSQIQLLPTTLILAHDRKPSHDPKSATSTGNAEIVGSGRMSQEPDVIHQVIRSDKRAPVVMVDCGKMREGEKPEPLNLYFDRVDFRLHPVSPFLHLLPTTESDLIKEAERRYGWKERRARDYIRILKGLPGIECEQEAANRSKLFFSTLSLADFRVAIEKREDPEEAEAPAVPSTSPGT